MNRGQTAFLAYSKSLAKLLRICKLSPKLLRVRSYGSFHWWSISKKDNNDNLFGVSYMYIDTYFSAARITIDFCIEGVKKEHLQLSEQNTDVKFYSYLKQKSRRFWTLWVFPFSVRGLCWSKYSCRVYVDMQKRELNNWRMWRVLILDHKGLCSRIL